jgi:hypothetical protein
MKPGEMYHATVDGKECEVYLTLICEGKGIERKDHWYRYAPPSNELVSATCKIDIGEVVERHKR